MARKGILTTNITPASAEVQPRQRLMPQGAVGALQSSLTKLQENAVQEIDAALIDMAGMEDRLGLDPDDQARLIESLRLYGQQVPVLLRPHPTDKGRFEIVYGRRRLAALRELGLPVKAMVRQLDDHALVMAQGQENSARTDLSFIEKASFSAQLDAAGYDRTTIAAALAMDLPMVSRMLKVGKAFDLAFLRRVGRAPSIGRERWMALVELIAEPQAQNRAEQATQSAEFAELPSDARFETVLAAAQNLAPKPPALPQRKTIITAPDGRALASVKPYATGVQLDVKHRNFDRWIEANAQDLVNEWFARWQAETNQETGGTAPDPK